MLYNLAQNSQCDIPYRAKKKRNETHMVLFFLIEWHSAMWVIIVFGSDSTRALLQMLISYPCGHLCYFMSSCDAIRNIRTTCCFFIYFIGAPQFFHFTLGKITFQNVERKLTQMLNKIIMQSMLKNLSKCEVKA